MLVYVRHPQFAETPLENVRQNGLQAWETYVLYIRFFQLCERA